MSRYDADAIDIASARAKMAAGPALQTTAEERAAYLEWLSTVNAAFIQEAVANRIRAAYQDIGTLVAALAEGKDVREHREAELSDFVKTAEADADENHRRLKEAHAAAAWSLIDKAAKDGTKVELIIADMYEPTRVTVTMGYWQDGRWWGSGISTHWTPVMYRRITDAQILAALAPHRPEIVAAVQAACDHHGDWDIVGDGRGDFVCSRCGADMGPRE